MADSSLQSTPFLIEPSELRFRDKEVLLIDCRHEGQYADGHIPGAIHLSTYNLFVRSTSQIGLSRFQRSMETIYRDAGVEPTRPVVVYEDQISVRAARECWLLQYLGHPSVRLLNGGLQAWRVGGGPVTTVESVCVPSPFSPEPQDQLVIGVRGVLAQAGLSDFSLLDVRTQDEFTGAGGTPCCPRQGRIPGANWLEWSTFVDRDTGCFKTVEAIQSLLQSRDIHPQKEISVYCHRGARSSIVYYALKLAGYPNVRNFIGSWHEWSARNDLPIETGV